MPQNLLITPKADSGASMRSRCLLQFGYIGLRFMRYQSSPWLGLAIALLKLPRAAGVERTHVRVRYFRTIARIDFVGVYGLLNDLLW
ncbi:MULTISPECIES: hypothetical protein [Trichocoleus]|uniref:Uncharacterized protein n=1 Tax=Trichocoleus desertorum GB2-A4 TaxID=2933944 RepID=A0ABV0JHC3_9CYAN|nr:hypothetical protein [Trichocoleus sp. FACHB-46]